MKITDAESFIDALAEMDAKPTKLPIYINFIYSDDAKSVTIAIGTSEKIVSSALSNSELQKKCCYDENLELFTPACCVLNNISTRCDFLRALKIYELCREFLAIGGNPDIPRPVNLPQMEMYHRGVHKLRPYEFQTKERGYSQDISMQNRTIDGVRLSDIVQSPPPEGYTSVRMSAPELIHFVNEFGLQMFERETIDDLKMYLIPSSVEVPSYIATQIMLEEYKKHANTKYKDLEQNPKSGWIRVKTGDPNEPYGICPPDPPRNPQIYSIENKQEKVLATLWWKTFDKLNYVQFHDNDKFRKKYSEEIIQYCLIGGAKLNITNMSYFGCLSQTNPIKMVPYEVPKEPRKIIADTVFVNRGVYESFYTFHVPNELKIYIDIAKTINRGDNVFKNVSMQLGKISNTANISIDLDENFNKRDSIVTLTPKELELIIAYNTEKFTHSSLLHNVTIGIIDSSHIQIKFRDNESKQMFLWLYDCAFENIQQLKSDLIVNIDGTDHINKTSKEMREDLHKIIDEALKS